MLGYLPLEISVWDAKDIIGWQLTKSQCDPPLPVLGGACTAVPFMKTKVTLM